jgi:hypothetical protein
MGSLHPEISQGRRTMGIPSWQRGCLSDKEENRDKRREVDKMQCPATMLVREREREAIVKEREKHTDRHKEKRDRV